MALTWARLLTVLNGGALFVSVALVALSPAVLYLTGYGMHLGNKAYPQGTFEWYRGPGWDPDTKHNVRLMYESSNEYTMWAAAAVSLFAGLIGIVGFFLTFKQSKPSFPKRTLYLLVLPGTMAFIVSLISFVFTQVVYDSHNHGKCYWEDGYNPRNVFHCTREQAACDIALYFTRDFTKSRETFDAVRKVCGTTQTGRQLVAPLFVASLLLCALAVGKFFVEKRQRKFVVSAEERVERLERQEQ